MYSARARSSLAAQGRLHTEAVDGTPRSKCRRVFGCVRKTPNHRQTGCGGRDGSAVGWLALSPRPAQCQSASVVLLSSHTCAIVMGSIARHVADKYRRVTGHLATQPWGAPPPEYIHSNLGVQLTYSVYLFQCAPSRSPQVRARAALHVADRAPRSCPTSGTGAPTHPTRMKRATH